jgi:tetratricopeptide (TPR) repeat protein
VARHCHQEALRVFCELGDSPAEAAELLNLGHATQHLGDWDEAALLFSQARDLFTDLGDRSGVAFAHLHLGKLALLRTRHDLANDYLVLALETAQEIGDWVAMAETLEGLGMLFSETGAPQRAASILGAAEALDWGVVERVVPANGLDAAVEDWLGHIDAAGPLALRAQKVLMRRWENLPADAAIAAGIEAFAGSWGSDEPARLMRGFLGRSRSKGMAAPHGS